MSVSTENVELFIVKNTSVSITSSRSLILLETLCIWVHISNFRWTHVTMSSMCIEWTACKCHSLLLKLHHVIVVVKGAVSVLDDESVAHSDRGRWWELGLWLFLIFFLVCVALLCCSRWLLWVTGKDCNSFHCTSESLLLFLLWWYRVLCVFNGLLVHAVLQGALVSEIGISKCATFHRRHTTITLMSCCWWAMTLVGSTLLIK